MHPVRVPRFGGALGTSCGVMDTKAESCAARAETSFHDDLREMVTRMRDCWIAVTNNLEFTEWAEAAAQQAHPAAGSLAE
jgi:hypothetical protein